MDIGQVRKQSITEELKKSYLDYAMSVIVARALPDVRDGLKPVHRRILYAMHGLSLHSSSKHRKSATIVGETLGKYHPHGDAAVYDAMVKMAQDFSSRYPLVNGQGNFGSMDGDSAAAMRYTEAKMTKLAEEMLADIDKETVDWTDNYDGTRKEPTVLPAKLPQLLLNGVTGIAVGMATSIPPHNLGEVIDALIYLIDNSDTTVEDLFKFFKGPDFPTGGEIYDKKALIQAYSLGEGPIVSKAKTEIVEQKAGKYQIVVHEMTYATNKANLITKIADLVKQKKIEGIKDVRDESDKQGVRVVVDLKNDVQPKKILNRLFKLTDLQKTFHLNMLALVDGIQPQILSLKGVLENYLEHRRIVVTRRTEYELRQAKERAHILEGLVKALDHIDKVIETIKKSKDKHTAHKNLMKNFDLSERQATAILEIKLQTLANLEQKRIKDELEEKRKLIARLEALLASPKKLMNLIKKEFEEVKEKYADARKTKVYSKPVGEISEEELVPEEECVIILTQGGYIKRVNPKNYKAQRRGGRGAVSITTREEDKVGYFLSASTYDDLLFFTDQGRVFQAKAYEVPEASRVSRGKAIVNLLQLQPDEKVTAILNISRDESAKYLVVATKNGIIKKTPLEDFNSVRKNGLIAINLKKGDKLGWARLSGENDEIMMITSKGQSIRFKGGNVRSMGRTAAGVKGIALKKDDKVVNMTVIRQEDKQGLKLFLVTENGIGKRTDLKNFKLQNRGGSGIRASKVTEKTGDIVGCQILDSEEGDLIAISQKGTALRSEVKKIPSLSRAAQGVKIMKLSEGDKLVSVACV